MLHNILTLAGAALVPLVLGTIWYNPKVFGTAWQNAAGLTDEKLKGANMPLIFGVSIFLSFLLAVTVIVLTIHQTHVGSLFQGDTSAEGKTFLENFMAAYGDRFRTFKHGALHGFLAGIFFVLPVLGTGALFERKGFRYIAINVGYWTLCLTLMGGIICQFLKLG